MLDAYLANLIATSPGTCLCVYLVINKTCLCKSRLRHARACTEYCALFWEISGTPFFSMPLTTMFWKMAIHRCQEG